MRKYLIFTLLIAFLLSTGIANAQMGGGISTPSWLYLDNATDTLKTVGNKSIEAPITPTGDINLAGNDLLGADEIKGVTDEDLDILSLGTGALNLTSGSGTIELNDILDLNTNNITGVGTISAVQLELTGDTVASDITISKSETPAYLKFDVDYAIPDRDDPIAYFQGISKNDAGEDVVYTELYFEIKDEFDGAENGRFDLKTMQNGSLATGMYLQGVGTALYPQVQFLGDANFQSRLTLNDDADLTFGQFGANSFRMEMDSAQTNKMFRIGVDTTSGTMLIDKGSTTNDHEIPVSTNYATVAIASGVTYDPDDSNNSWMAYRYDGDFVILGADQEGTGLSPAILNNGVLLDLSDITDTQLESYGMKLERDINDSNTGSGNDTYAQYWSDLSITDGTGANYEYHFLGTTDDVDVFTVDEEGTIVSPRTYLADITTPTDDRLEIYHGASGSVAGASTHASYKEGYYAGNVTAGTLDLVNVYSEGMTTAGNLIAGRSTTINGHASDVANSFLAGAIYDFNANSTGATSTGVACLFTNDPWDYCTVSVAGDNIMSAVLVGPGDGKNTGIVGGAGVTGGSDQLGGDAYMQVGAGAGGGDAGNAYVYGDDGSTELIMWNGEDGYEEFAGSEDYGGGYFREMITEQTVDATVTTTWESSTVNDNEAYYVTAKVTAMETDGTNRAVYHISGLFYRDGGNVSQEGTTVAINETESAGITATWDADFALDTGNQEIEVQVTGGGSDTVNWKVEVEYELVTSS